MDRHRFSPGDLILREGDDSDVVYEIRSGEVEIFSEAEGGLVVLGTVQDGEFLGEMGVIDGRTRSASARAKTEVMVTVLDKGEFMKVMSKNPTAAYRLIHRLSERLRAANSKLVVTSLSDRAVETSGPGSFRISLAPATRFLTPYLPHEGIVIRRFPYTVGRRPKSNESEPSVRIDLALPDVSPFRLSRRHFCITRASNAYDVLDLGSRLGTEVNGEFLGQHFGNDQKRLEVGENAIRAGGVDSNFTFKVILEKL